MARGWASAAGELLAAYAEAVAGHMCLHCGTSSAHTSVVLFAGRPEGAECFLWLTVRSCLLGGSIVPVVTGQHILDWYAIHAGPPLSHVASYNCPPAVATAPGSGACGEARGDEL